MMSALLTLPLEVRDLIYKIAVTYEVEPVEQTTQDDHHYEYGTCTCDWPPHFSFTPAGEGNLIVPKFSDANKLRLVCRQFRDELDQLYGREPPTAVLQVTFEQAVDDDAALWPLWLNFPLLRRPNTPLNLRLEVILNEACSVNNVYDLLREMTFFYKNDVYQHCYGLQKIAAHPNTCRVYVPIEPLHKLDIHITRKRTSTASFRAMLVSTFRAQHDDPPTFKEWNAAEVRVNGILCWPSLQVG